MYLQYRSWNVFKNFCPDNNMALIKMMECNNSRFLNGYHGLQHIVRTLNTSSFLCETLYSEDRNDNRFIQDDNGNIKATTKKFNNLYAALIWHDCNYYSIDYDYRNTELAIDSLLNSYNNDSYQTTLDIDVICYYINGLQYPYKETDDLQILLLRDCDLSMILYEDYFDPNGLCKKLLENEFSGFPKQLIKEKTNNFIMGLNYNNPKLNNILNEIGKQNLWEKTENLINFLF